MNAAELRIGNYVIDKLSNRIVRISGIEVNQDFIWVDFAKGSGQYKISINEIKPIELTEEILLKFGFKKLGDVFCVSEKCVIDFNENRIGIYIDRIAEDIDLDLPKFFHQLQNLYFALTNEELEIDLG